MEEFAWKRAVHIITIVAFATVPLKIELADIFFFGNFKIMREGTVNAFLAFAFQKEFAWCFVLVL